MKNTIAIILTCIVTFQFCTNPQLRSKELVFIEKNYPSIPLENPQLYKRDSFFLNQGLGYIYIVYADTLEGEKAADLLLDYYPEQDSLAFRAYSQHWKDSLFEYIVSIEKDTVEFYKENLNTKELTFYIGEYAYKRIRNHFSKDSNALDEIIYYDLHRDSLRKVRGNNLPPLPKPTEEDRKIWEEKFGNHTP